MCNLQRAELQLLPGNVIACQMISQTCYWCICICWHTLGPGTATYIPATLLIKMVL